MSYPKQFLKLLNEQQNRTVYVRITSLSLDEIPQDQILGNASQGSVNIDGNSAVRRTCSLTLTTDKIDFKDGYYYWAINSKFKLEIGLKNNVDTNFEEIIWFNQGVYYISSFNCSLTTNNYTINISGKDKMCGLNGEIGGTLTSSVDFGTIEETDSHGNTTIKKLPIKTIIAEMLHTYAKEPYHNIILNDLDELGLELQEYKYDVPLYLWRKVGNSAADAEYTGATLNGDMIWYTQDSKSYHLSEISDSAFESLSDELMADSSNRRATQFCRVKGGKPPYYYLTKIQYGNTAGYKESELVYSGDLIANPGETLTSILDKIKTMLGEFEYFYNVDGQFVFQKKKTYVNTAWTPVVSTDNGSYVDTTQEPIAYSFNNLDFFTSFANTPNIANLRNDFTVWGTKKSSTGKELACHMRYAVQNKPILYTSIVVEDEELVDYNNKYGFSLKGQQSQTFISKDIDWEIKEHYDAEYDGKTSTLYIYTPEFEASVSGNTANLEGKYLGNNIGTLALTSIAWNVLECDWRELIYRMALDYRKYNHLDDFELRVARANPEFFPDGRTGFEQYYIDMEGFWRQLYNREPYVKAYVKTEADFNNYVDQKISLYKKEDNTTYVLVKTYDKSIEYYKWDDNFYPKENDLYPWSRIPYERPEDLIFWFDFLEVGEPLAKFSVDALGPRTKVDNNKDVKAIQYRETPKVIFYDGVSAKKNSGYRYLNAGRVHYKQMFSPSAQGLSAKTAIDNLLYNNLIIIESVTINSIPIYSLQPNTLIRIDDDTNNIHGDYIVSKLTVPLAYNGTMSITATKFIDKFL